MPNTEFCRPFVAGYCVLLVSKSGAMRLSATVLRRSGLGFSGLVLFSRRVSVSGSFTREREQIDNYVIVGLDIRNS